MSTPVPDAPVRVSVVLPVHDVGPPLAHTLDRLLATLRADDELLLVDDGSTDDTAEVARRWLDDHPEVTGRWRLLELPDNVGVAAARNTALPRLQGEAVWFVDWDDTWDEQILDRLHAAWSSSGRTLAVCAAEQVDEQGLRLRRLGPRVRRRVTLEGSRIGLAVLEGDLQGYLWNKLYAREALGEAPFPLVRSQSDFAGTAELIAGQTRVAMIPDLLYAHVRRDGSITNTTYPSMDSFARSLEVAERIADRLRRDTDGQVSQGRVTRALRAFRYREYHLTVANTALRLSHDDRYRHQMLGTALRGMRWREIALLAGHAPLLAVRVALLLVTGHRYPVVYDAYVRLRERTQRWRRPRHRVDEGELAW